jgi:DNA-binding CsgD family transcriptional regulator
LGAFIRKVELLGLDSVIYWGGFVNKPFTIHLPYKYNQLQIEYSSNDFENPQSLSYSTFVEGVDKEWTEWQSQSKRELTNIRHGTRTFKVKAKNIFGTESNVSTIDIEIAPPWYLKWWAYGIYFFVLLGGVFLISKYVRYRIAKSQIQEKERQERLFREREKQLQTEALEAEKEVIKLRNEKLNVEMKQKDKELANSTMDMIHKSKSLIGIKKELTKLARGTDDDYMKDQFNILIRKINREIDSENQWEVFEKHFENVHEEFINRLKSQFPDLTPREMKLCAYLRLNISSKEIATLMNISTRGVEISRYRLRKKLNLEHNTNLTSFIMSF